MRALLSGVAFVVPLLIIAVRSVRARRSPREIGSLAALSVALSLFVNPLGQAVTLSHLDGLIRNRWAAQIHVGMSTEALSAALGAPCERRPDVWEFAPVPFFWASHDDHFTVFVDRDRVVGVVRGG